MFFIPAIPVSGNQNEKHGFVSLPSLRKIVFLILFSLFVTTQAFALSGGGIDSVTNTDLPIGAGGSTAITVCGGGSDCNGNVGNVGIGTTAPASKLTVNGNVTVLGLATQGSDCSQYETGAMAQDSNRTGVVYSCQVRTVNGNTVKVWTPSGGAGLASAWVNFNGAQCSPYCTIRGSYNIASVFRNNTGNYTVTFAKPFSSNGYAAVAQQYSFNTYGGSQVFSQTANSLVILTTSAGEGSDQPFISLIIFGP